MAFGRQLYNSVFRKSSTFALSILVGAVVFERMFDQAGDAIFEHLNKGKLWKHIKHNYESHDKE
ncbi:QCR9 protein, partial [Polyodon spathula]|nr:QCR9 protein [Polyodon spathula]